VEQVITETEGASIDIPLRQDQQEHLRLLCKEMGRTPEDFAKEAILTFMEDYEDRQLADEAMKMIQVSGSHLKRL